MKVLVVGGGISPERPVSLRSADAVAKALEKANHSVTKFDWDGGSDWLTKNAPDFDVVFPVLHGIGGEDGQIQRLLESLSCRYVGTDSAHSAVCMDKLKTRQRMLEAHIPIAEGAEVDWAGYRSHALYAKPHVLKPVKGGSSIDTFIVNDPSVKPMNVMQKAFAAYQTMLLEEYISGKEITVPILDGKELPVIEIVPPQGGTFDYANKYNGATKELCPPQHVAESTQEKAQKLAERCHESMGCRHLSRTDMIVRADGSLIVLEINTMPGMTDQSLFPKAAAVSGIDMSELVDYLVLLAAGVKND